MNNYDVIIIGAGAAGLMAANQLQKRNKNVLIIDMGNRPARKIEISGGGNCNFTNLHANYTHYFGKNPRFVTSALTQFSPINMLDFIKENGVKFIEKEPGRYFCENGSKNVINTLTQRINFKKAIFDTRVLDIEKNGDIFVVKTEHKNFNSKSVIIATGGMSYSYLGVSDIGQMIAKKFGHKIEPVRPALCAIKTQFFGDELSGISLPVIITIDKHKIADNLLFTHFGIGGPATYRATLLNRKQMNINFTPDINVFELLKSAKQTNGKKSVANILSSVIPNKLARFLCKNDNKNIADYKDSELQQIANQTNNFEITDATPIGMQSAEVMAGGVSTDKISSKTMESQLCPGLFFAGEVMDITGDLGGYNLQWAFSSGFVAGNNA